MKLAFVSPPSRSTVWPPRSSGTALIAAATGSSAVMAPRAPGCCQPGGEAVHDELGHAAVLVIGGAADGDAAHPGRIGGTGAIGRVLDHHRVLGRDRLGPVPVDVGQRRREALGVRLAGPDLVDRDDGRNELFKARELQDVLDLLPERTRRDAHGHVVREGADEGDGVVGDGMAIADRRPVAPNAVAEQAILVAASSGRPWARNRCPNSTWSGRPA